MPRLPLALALTLALTACTAPPDDAPEASGETAASAASLTGTYTREHEVGILDGEDYVPTPTADRLVLVEDGDSLRVTFSLVRTNAHLCGWSGAMAPEAGGWVSREALDRSDAATCTLRLEVAADTLTLRDEDWECRRYLCGARALIDGATFARSTWSPDTSTVDLY